MDRLVVDVQEGEHTLVELSPEEAQEVEAAAAQHEVAGEEEETRNTRANAVRNKLLGVIVDLEAAAGTKAAWDALTVAQRQEATRRAVLATAKLVRYTLRQLDAEE